MSSNSHRFVSWDPENFSPVEEGYSRLKTYALTKMYNVRLVHGCIYEPPEGRYIVMKKIILIY